MIVTVLGSGTILPSERRGPSGYLVETGEVRVLLDGGPGTARTLARCGFGLGDLDHVFYTHFHVDHIGDLVPILFALRNPSLSRRRPLSLIGPPGFLDLTERLTAAFSWIPAGCRDGRYSFGELSPGRHVVADLDVEVIGVNHSPEAVGYRLRGPSGRVLAYSGDTGPCEGAVTLGAGAEVYILECAFPDEMAIPTHMTPSACADAARRAGPTRLVLTHFYPEMEAAPAEAFREVMSYGGRSILATDGLRMEV